ncbi:MAG: thioredoxin domain-containing protein [Lysobacteraceae bacterium]|nr:MAG: thioredoxin domain-containing protein [Xanthomonadaceae bacterium]
MARTRHLNADGTPQFSNRLAEQSSPYLKQHAHNPVDWHPWGDDAFALARQRKVPVLLSIGYSTCHWCHVMEHESFEDLEIAQYMNEHYICIKVDREERPDIDAIYMAAVQAISGHGGWPMTVWLTADAKPFYAGTYFPPREGVRGARVGFLSVLRELKRIFDQEPDKVSQSSSELSDYLQRVLSQPAAGEIPDESLPKEACEAYLQRVDWDQGGVRGAPKFPSSLPATLLLERYAIGGEKPLLDAVTTSLKAMADGGLHDQFGGGFHRYSVDDRWLVPHFEKMLYDNALLVMDYLHAYQLTGDQYFKRIVERTLDYVRREMTATGGAFFSATDADSLTPDGTSEEGWFFTWTYDELEQVLSADDATLIARVFSFTDEGHFEGRNIPHLTESLQSLAEENQCSPQALQSKLDALTERLYQHRATRPAPGLDDKILSAWNGLMISAFAKAGHVLARADYVQAAVAAATFIEAEMVTNSRLLRSHGSGIAGFLDDYSFMIQGYLDLFVAEPNAHWLQAAMALESVLDRHYKDNNGGYFMTANDQPALLAREKPRHDGAEPSGNSIMAINHLRLYTLTDDDAFRQRAVATIESFSQALSQQAMAMAHMTRALQMLNNGQKLLVIVRPTGSAPQLAADMVATAHRTLPAAVATLSIEEGDPQQALAHLVPALTDKATKEGRVTAFLCSQSSCMAPCTEVTALEQQMSL